MAKFENLPNQITDVLTEWNGHSGMEVEDFITRNLENLDKADIKSIQFDSASQKLIIPYNFNYGYAITCWKAQGSEYPYVLSYDCSWLKKKDVKEYTKYLYTAVTRAEKAIILVGD